MWACPEDQHNPLGFEEFEIQSSCQNKTKQTLVCVCPLSKRALVFNGANLSMEFLTFKIVVPRSITHTEFVKPERGHNVTRCASTEGCSEFFLPGSSFQVAALEKSR